MKLGTYVRVNFNEFSWVGQIIGIKEELGLRLISCPIIPFVKYYIYYNQLPDVFKQYFSNNNKYIFPSKLDSLQHKYYWFFLREIQAL